MSDHYLLILIVVLLLVQQKGGWDAFLKDLWKMAWGLTILAYFVAFFGLGWLFISTKPLERDFTLLFGIVALPMLVWSWRKKPRARREALPGKYLPRSPKSSSRHDCAGPKLRSPTDLAAWMRYPPPAGRVAFFLAWTLGLALLGLFVLLCANAPTEVLWRVAGCVAMVVLVCVTMGWLAATANKAIQRALRRSALPSPAQNKVLFASGRCAAAARATAKSS